jgi:alpha-L-rhamnosidase
MNSFNHYAYGAIGQFLYQYVAGIDIDSDDPGYKYSIIRPVPHSASSIRWAGASLETPYGLLSSKWHFFEDQWIIDVSVPPNTRSSIHIPLAANESSENYAPSRIFVDGQTPEENQYVTITHANTGQMVLAVGSGDYCISVPWKESETCDTSREK